MTSHVFTTISLHHAGSKVPNSGKSHSYTTMGLIIASIPVMDVWMDGHTHTQVHSHAHAALTYQREGTNKFGCFWRRVLACRESVN